MDPSIPEEFCANLSLVEEEPHALVAEKDALEVEMARLDLCLVGKVLSARMINREAFRAGMVKL